MEGTALSDCWVQPDQPRKVFLGEGLVPTFRRQAMLIARPTSSLRQGLGTPKPSSSLS